MLNESSNPIRPLVDFVVCTRNDQASVGATLDSIAGQTVRPITCTIVDALSSDGTVEFVRERYPWVRTHIKQTDSGPADSRNIGQSFGSAEFVAFLDSDVTLSADWAAAQIALLRSRPTIGMAGGKLLYPPLPDTLYSAHGVMSCYGVGWDGGRAQPSASFVEVVRCVWVNSAAMFVRRSLLERMGGFDVQMYLGCEDSDIGWRANLFGAEVVFNPKATAEHHMHGAKDASVINTAAAPGFRSEAMTSRLYYIWRNRLRSILVNYEVGSLVRYTVPYLAMSIADAALKPPRAMKWRALWWNVAQLRDTLARRTCVQSHRTVRDREIRPLFCSALRGPGYAFFPHQSHHEHVPPGLKVTLGVQ
ncbi:MAG: glycosyltransferase [Acidobacteria bacterium]|nr:glycosyltransferase [Acidobacteriota bacterium]